MFGNSRPVISTQTGVSENLQQLVQKHLNTTYRKPFHPFSLPLFERLDQHVRQDPRPILLDAGCGNGDSTFELARRYPDRLVIGIDKSGHRLRKYLADDSFYVADNMILARADLVDFWRWSGKSEWTIQKQYLFYPNPWPKPEQLKRRWHGHPVFSDILKTCTHIELRTNWLIYAEEFQQALATANIEATLEEIVPDSFISPFEQKYHQSGHSLYRIYTR